MVREKPTKLWRLPDEWRALKAQAVASGSAAQMINVLEMAVQDLLALDDALNSEISPWYERRPLDENIKFRR